MIKTRKPQSSLLLVDDSPYDLATLATFLTEYHLFTATNGLQALSIANQEQPDLILLDIGLPDMTGYEICQQLKQQPNTKNIPVIFVSGLTEEGDEAQGFEAGAVDYITKPIRPSIVRARVAIQLMIKKQHEQLLLTANTDMLTGIANRRHFETVVQNEWNRALRYQKPLCLIMIDVDYFGHYNDLYGHAAGDDCLKAIANSLDMTLRRGGDMVARWGGEEFVCLLPEMPLEQAIKLAEKILHRIHGLRITHAGSTVNDYVTASLGLAALDISHHTAWQTLLKQADQALYRAKNQGRNRLVW
ncbi:MAG: diguanylate cyclase [Methylococcaceae bacterium]